MSGWLFNCWEELKAVFSPATPAHEEAAEVELPWLEQIEANWASDRSVDEAWDTHLLLTAQLPARAAIAHDRHVRHSAYQRHRSAGSRSAPNSPLCAWRDISSRNGYWREAALHRISEAPNAFLAVALFQRLNDWVPQVRVAARAAVRRAIENSGPAVLAEAWLATWPSFCRWNRIEENERPLFFDIKDHPPVFDLLVQTIKTQRSGPMAGLLGQLGRNPRLDPLLVEIAKQATQPAVRAAAYGYLMRGRITWFEERRREWINKPMGYTHAVPKFGSRDLTMSLPFRPLFEQAVADPSSNVRRMAAAALVDRRADLGHQAFELAQLLADDPYPSIAERAQFVLRDRD